MFIYIGMFVITERYIIDVDLDSLASALFQICDSVGIMLFSRKIHEFPDSVSRYSGIDHTGDRTHQAVEP